MAAKIKLNGAGFVALLQGPEVQADLKRRARRIALAAGPGMVAENVRLSRKRARVTVKTATPEARKAEAERRALTQAIDAGRS